MLRNYWNEKWRQIEYEDKISKKEKLKFQITAES